MDLIKARIEEGRWHIEEIDIFALEKQLNSGGTFDSCLAGTFQNVTGGTFIPRQSK